MDEQNQAKTASQPGKLEVIGNYILGRKLSSR